MPRIIRIERIIDANFNRAKEGLRVCEEITRFILENRSLTKKLKDARHEISGLMMKFPGSRNLLQQRESSSDIGREIYAGELKRKSCKDIFSANIQRVKESLRVLEEFTKLKDINLAIEFKKLRYRVYEIEKLSANLNK